MKHKTCPNRICDISEPDFWRHVRVSGAVENAERLAKAVRLGRGGRKADAYRALADYHRVALADLWAMERARAAGQSPADRRKAEDVLKLKITGWHALTVQFQGKIDWSGRPWGVAGQYGFHYLGWLVPAVDRFIDRGEKRYREGLIRVFDSYYEARNSLTWRHSHLHPVYYELGAWAKTRVLLPLYLALIHTGNLAPRTIEGFAKLLLGFGRSLCDLQRGYRPGNWQIVGNSGLFRLARTFPEFTESPAWEKTARKYLLEHLRKDFFSDGSHSERCWGYGYMSLRGILDAYDTACRRGGLEKDRPYLLRKIRKTFRWYAKTLGPKDRKPAYGDCSLDRCGHILDAAQPYFPKGTGRDLGVDRTRSCLLRPSGFAVMRNGAGDDDAYLNLSFGRFAGGHSHMDTLSLNFWAKGLPLLEEVGRFDSYDNPLDQLFRTPASHNMLTIDGQHFDAVDPGNLRGRDVQWHSSPQADFLSAYHTAYRRNPLESESINAVVRRTVVFVKDPGYALVLDAVLDPGNSNTHAAVTQNWHSPFPFTVVGAGAARTKGRAAMLVVFARTEHLRRLATGVDFAGDEVTVRSEFPDRYWLRARRWMPIGHVGAIGFATLLYPFRGAAPKVSIRPVSLQGQVPLRAEAFEVRTPAGRDLLVLNPERLDGVKWGGADVTGRGWVRLGRRRGKVALP